MYLVCRLLLRQHPASTLFPYTTLFRSADGLERLQLDPLAQPAGELPLRTQDEQPVRRRHQREDEEEGQDGKDHRRPPYATRSRCSNSDGDRKSTRLNSSHRCISYAVFCFANTRPLPSFPTRRSSGLPMVLSVFSSTRSRSLPVNFRSGRRTSSQ